MPLKSQVVRGRSVTVDPCSVNSAYNLLYGDCNALIVVMINFHTSATMQEW
jgi:hypothetical protein